MNSPIWRPERLRERVDLGVALADLAREQLDHADALVAAAAPGTPCRRAGRPPRPRWLADEVSPRRATSPSQTGRPVLPRLSGEAHARSRSASSRLARSNGVRRRCPPRASGRRSGAGRRRPSPELRDLAAERPRDRREQLRARPRRSCRPPRWRAPRRTGPGAVLRRARARCEGRAMITDEHAADRHHADCRPSARPLPNASDAGARAESTRPAASTATTAVCRTVAPVAAISGPHEQQLDQQRKGVDRQVDRCTTTAIAASARRNRPPARGQRPP